MKQSYLMTNDQADKKKNLEAGAYTTVILIALALLLFLVSWQLPQPVEPDPPLDQQGIEVNLGTGETGFGSDQPLLPGEPAPDVAKSAASVPDETSGDNSPDDPDSDVSTPKNETKTKTRPSETPKIKQPATKPVENAGPKLKQGAQLGKTSPNSNGTGGNGADSYYKGSNQGIAGGKGDQGKPGGDPNSDSYTGDGKGKGGIKIRSGLDGRRITGNYSFTDEFNRNATVYVDVTVDAGGKVISATVNPKGTTTTDANIRSIAIRKAYQIKFNAGSQEQKGTLAFEFKVNG